MRIRWISPLTSRSLLCDKYYWPKMLKKGQKSSFAEECKVSITQEKGNEAYRQGDFERAVECYSSGLEAEPCNAVLLSNRSAAYLALHRADESLADATKAIECDATNRKVYFRKANALRSIDRLSEALEVVTCALALFGTHPELEAFQASVQEELLIRQKVPLDHPERAKFSELESWLKSGGAVFPKLTMRFYSVDYRGVHSTSFIPVDLM